MKEREKVSKSLGLKGKDGQNVCIQKDPCHHQSLVDGSDKKDASEKEISAPSRDPAIKSRAQPGQKAYCVISPFYSSQFGLNQSHGEGLCKI